MPAYVLVAKQAACGVRTRVSGLAVQCLSHSAKAASAPLRCGAPRRSVKTSQRLQSESSQRRAGVPGVRDRCSAFAPWRQRARPAGPKGSAFPPRPRVAEVSIPARPGLEPELLAGARPEYRDKKTLPVPGYITIRQDSYSHIKPPFELKNSNRGKAIAIRLDSRLTTIQKDGGKRTTETKKAGTFSGFRPHLAGQRWLTSYGPEPCHGSPAR